MTEPWYTEHFIGLEDVEIVVSCSHPMGKPHNWTVSTKKRGESIDDYSGNGATIEEALCNLVKDLYVDLGNLMIETQAKDMRPPS